MNESLLKGLTEHFAKTPKKRCLSDVRGSKSDKVNDLSVVPLNELKQSRARESYLD